MSTVTRSQSSSPTDQLAIQLQGASMSLASSSSSAVETNPDATTVRRAGVDTAAEIRAAAAQAAVARDEATVALYAQLGNPTPFTKIMGPRLDEEASPPPPVLNTLRGAFPALRAGTLAERATEARQRLANIPANLRREIRAINLANAGLTCLPEELSNLSPMILDLAGNRFTSFPQGLPEGIIRLDLSNNAIESSQETIQIPRSLRFLLIGHNRLTAFPSLAWRETATDEMAEMGVNECLQILSLAHNQIRELPRDLSQLSLEALDLSSNQITEIPADARLPDRMDTLLLPFNRVAALPADMRNFHSALPNNRELIFDLTENPIGSLAGVQKRPNLALVVGPQCTFDPAKYLFIGEGRVQPWIIRPFNAQIGDVIFIGRTTPGPYMPGRFRLIQTLYGGPAPQGGSSQALVETLMRQRAHLQHLPVPGCGLPGTLTLNNVQPYQE